MDGRRRRYAASVQSRRDQLHAYRFQVRRAVAALVVGEPDVPEPPMRRLTITTIAGLMIAIVVGAGFAVVGLIRPSTTEAWRQPGTVIVEKETGARFILVDGTLHPVLNYTSAVLALGDQRASVELVARSALEDTPRGATIGIDGLPDSLPPAPDLIASPWSVCSQVTRSAANVTSVEVALAGGSDQGAQPIVDDAAVLVAAPDGASRYLLWSGQRLRIASPAVAAALGLDTVPPLPVGTALLNALPPGPDLVAPAVPGAGAPGPQIGGAPTVVGQLAAIADSAKRYLVLADGVQAVTPVLAALLRTLRINGAIVDPLVTDESAVLRAGQSTAWSSPAGLPAEVPELDPAAAAVGGVCVVDAAAADDTDGADGAALAIGVPDAPTLSAPITGAVTESAASAAGQADRVDIAPGRAALVRADSEATTLYLVAAPGEKFPMTQGVLPAFGYSIDRAIALPGQFLLMMPTGPALDPSAARREVGVSGRPSPAPS